MVLKINLSYVMIIIHIYIYIYTILLINNYGFTMATDLKDTIPFYAKIIL